MNSASVAQVCAEDMRHDDISTTMTYYVDLNAEEMADAVWSAIANTFANTGPAKQQTPSEEMA